MVVRCLILSPLVFGLLGCNLVLGNEEGQLAPGSTSSCPMGDTILGYREQVLCDAPAAYWRLGESTGPTAHDETGHGHDGSYFGTVTYGQPGALSSDKNSAVGFKCCNQFVGVGHVFDFAGTAAFTLEAWVNTQIEGSFQRICGKSEEDKTGYSLYIDPNGLLAFTRTSAGIADELSGSAPLTVDTYYYIVATFEDGTMKLYVNGVLDVQLLSTASPPVTTADFELAAKLGGTQDPLSGLLDEVAVYDHALSKAEIEAHFRAARP